MISLKNMFFGLLPNRVKAARLWKRQRRELNGMSERELADLGIGASEIPFLFLRESSGYEQPVDAPSIICIRNGLNTWQTSKEMDIVS